MRKRMWEGDMVWGRAGGAGRCSAVAAYFVSVLALRCEKVRTEILCTVRSVYSCMGRGYGWGT